MPSAATLPEAARAFNGRSLRGGEGGGRGEEEVGGKVGGGLFLDDLLEGSDGGRGGGVGK